MLISRRIWFEYFYDYSLITVLFYFFGHRVEIVLTITNATLTVKIPRTAAICEYKLMHCLHTYVLSVQLFFNSLQAKQLVR